MSAYNYAFIVTHFSTLNARIIVNNQNFVLSLFNKRMSYEGFFITCITDCQNSFSSVKCWSFF